MKIRKIGSFFAYIAMIAIVSIVIITKINSFLEIDLGKVMLVMQTVKDMSVLLALGICGYEFTKGRSKTFLLIYVITVIIWLAFIVMNLI